MNAGIGGSEWHSPTRNLRKSEVFVKRFVTQSQRASGPQEIETMKKPEFLLRDFDDYDEVVAKIYAVLEEEEMTLIESLGILDIIREDLHRMSYEGSD